jgi:hypothetical protein
MHLFQLIKKLGDFGRESMVSAAVSGGGSGHLHYGDFFFSLPSLAGQTTEYQDNPGARSPDLPTSFYAKQHASRGIFVLFDSVESPRVLRRI